MFGVEHIVLAGDLVVLVGTYLVLVLGFDKAGTDPPNQGLWVVGLVVAWLFVASWRPHQRSMLGHRFQSAYVVAENTLVAGAIFYLLPLIGGAGQSRISNVMSVGVLAGTMAAWRMALAGVVKIPTEDLVVVGGGWAGRTFAEALARRPHAGMRIIAFVDSDPTIAGRYIMGAGVYPVSALSRLIQRPGGLARVVLANAGEADPAVVEQLMILAQRGVAVAQMSTLYEQLTGCIPVRYLGNYWWAVLPRPSSSTLYWIGKRTLDIAISLAGLFLLAVMLPVLWPLVRRHTGGSPLFKQVRVGKYGQSFTLYKLRTLAASPPHVDDWRTRKAANRPTRLCACIRAAGLDELPQLLNVLRGEMALVGPRPYVPEEVTDLQEQIPFFRTRTLVRPGLTGWAQINYGYGLTLEDEVEKAQRDLYYIGHQSTYLDLLIMLKTLAMILRGRRPTSSVTLSALTASALNDWPAPDPTAVHAEVG
jgi:lipopolysaccharide/colanic/teichoic acid biosynthesis glycosyltransferase